MATPKFNRLAEIFMQRIQDPITLDGGSPEKFLPGAIVRTVKEIERYLHTAGQSYFDAMWKAAQPTEDLPGSYAHKTKFLTMFPEMFTFASISVPFVSPNSVLDLTVLNKDVHDILDSVKSGGGGMVEVWDASLLGEALAESNPFYSPPRVKLASPGMVLQQPLLYLFPINIADGADYTFNLQYIRNIKNATTGDIVRSGDDDDIPYSENSIDQIAEIAAQLYKTDDFQEDAG